MEEVTLKIGNQTLKLTKSEDLVAIKPELNQEQEALSAIKSTIDTGEAEPNTLGGFILVKAENTSKEEVGNQLDILRLNSAVDIASHVFYSSDDQVPLIPSNELYVECAEDANLSDCNQLFTAHKLGFVEARGDRQFILRVTPESENPIKVAVALQQSPLIAIAEPELITPQQLYNFVVPKVKRFPDLWHLQNVGKHGKQSISMGFVAGADARVVEAWEHLQHLGSPEVIVAVIDDGFDLDHPAFSDPDKLIAPWDFTGKHHNPTPSAKDWHGTACAGVAVGSPSSEILGAAPHCRLMPVRWGISISDSDIEAWFDYVREKNAWVVSCSWGVRTKNFPLSTRASRAIERCAKEGRNGLGCVICFAAGNDNRNVNQPATGSVNGFAIHPDVIAVAASTSQAQKADYSNYGQEIHVCAPSSGAGGWGITTSDVRSSGYSRGKGYTNTFDRSAFGGTSSACPLVAGICALILSIKPDLTSQEVKQLLQKTARKIDDQKSYDASGHSPYYGYGCVDAASAVKEVLKISRST
jgi:subtilisin family serine protease